MQVDQIHIHKELNQYLWQKTTNRLYLEFQAKMKAFKTYLLLIHHLKVLEIQIEAK